MRARSARARLIKELDGLAPALLKKVDTAISPEDTMWISGPDRYFRIGLDAVRCIESVYTSTGIAFPTRILDMPSGAGRVLRFIALRFPNAELTACDVIEDHIKFCAKRFGANPVLSSPDFDGLALPGPFDLIWSGSLVTHLNGESTEAYLRLCRENLSPDGILVLTTHGEEVAHRIATDPRLYGLDDRQSAAVVSQYQHEQLGFVEYSTPHGPQVAGYSSESAPFGVSLMSREWVKSAAARAGMHELYFAEHDWNAHHDVYGFVPSSHL
jgi:SAM-dependent methyltransferase